MKLNIMYSITRKIVLLIVIAGLVSCDLLNQPEPKQSIAIDEGLETIKDYNALLVGVYNSFQQHAAQYVELNDYMSDNVFWIGSFPEYVEIASQQVTVNNRLIEDLWNVAYQSINGSNIIINGIVEVDAPQSEIDNILGQALFLRAIQYYYLVQYYAKPWGTTTDNSHLGVPLQLKPVLSQTDFQVLGRATLKEVYDQIIADLKKAQGLISNTDPNRATNGAVTALLARIALVQDRYADAAALAGDIMDDTKYELSDNVTDYFRNEFSSESIFEVQNTQQDAPGGGNYTLSVVYNILGRDGAHISDSYKQALKNIITNSQEAAINASNQIAIDTRVTELLATDAEPPLEISDYTNTSKYEDEVNVADNPPILRLSEMILTRAEALAEVNGINQESIDLLNKIRMRAIEVKTANGDPGNESLIEFKMSDFSTKQELIDAILLERQVELSFEGHRTTDLQRRKLDVKGTQWDADRLTFPIPQSQIDASDGKIKQNPGYGA